MALSVHRLMQAIAGGGGSAAPLRFVSTGNVVAGGTRAFAGVILGAAVKDTHYIGSGDVNKLVISFSNFSFNETVFNAFNVMELWVTMDGGSTHQVTWSGSTTTTVAAGEVEHLSDPLYPSDFGLGVFARGQKFYVGYRVEVASAGMVLPSDVDANPTLNSSIMYTPGTTTISHLNDSAAMTWTTGVSAVGDNATPPCHVYGTFVSGDAPVFMGTGDSITWGTGTGVNTYLPGWFYQSLFDNFASFTNARAGVKGAFPGANASLWSTNPAKLAQIVKRANSFIERFGINAIASDGGQAGANAIIADRKLYVWDVIRANPSPTGRQPKIAAMAMTPHTTSTIPVSSISGDGTTCTATTTSAFVSSIGGIGATRTCVIAGATPAGYNTVATGVTMTVASATTVTYANATTGASSGTITISDLFATVSNQTPTPGCGLGQEIALLETTLLSLVGAGAAGPDYYIDNTAGVRGNASNASADYWKWAGGMTTDGLHPASAGYVTMCPAVVTWMQSQ